MQIYGLRSLRFLLLFQSFKNKQKAQSCLPKAVVYVHFFPFQIRLDKTCDYIFLKPIYSFFSGIIHFIEDRRRALNWGLTTQRML